MSKYEYFTTGAFTEDDIFGMETSLVQMDPAVALQIDQLAEDGHDRVAIEEICGVEPVRQRLKNNPQLQELLEPGDHAA